MSKSKSKKSKSPKFKPQYCQLSMERGEGLRLNVLVLYNSQGRVYSLIKEPTQKKWLPHQDLFPMGCTPELVKKIFDKFKKNAREIDSKARIKEGIGNPKV